MSTNYEELEKLHDMLEKGIIDEQDFQMMKKKILEENSQSTQQVMEYNPGMKHILLGALVSGIAGFLLIFYIAIVLPGLLVNLTNFYSNINVIGAGSISIAIFLILAVIAGYILAIYGLNQSKKFVGSRGISGLGMIMTTLILWISSPFIILFFSLFSSEELFITGSVIALIMTLISYIIAFIGWVKVRRDLPTLRGMGFILAYFILNISSYLFYQFIPLFVIVLYWVISYVILLVGLFQLKFAFSTDPSYR